MYSDPEHQNRFNFQLKNNENDKHKGESNVTFNTGSIWTYSNVISRKRNREFVLELN